MVNYNNYKKPKSNLLLYSGVALVVMVVIALAVYFFFFTGNDPKAIAVDCVGDWTQDATCPIDCGQSASKVVATYSVTTPMESGGKTCDFTDGATKEVDCPETDECPIDCVGYYDETTVTCPTACGNPASTLTQNYVTTIASSGSGVQCPSSTRSINCAATDECPGPEYDGTIEYSGLSGDNYVNYCREQAFGSFIAGSRRLVNVSNCSKQNIRKNCRNECEEFDSIPKMGL